MPRPIYSAPYVALAGAIIEMRQAAGLKQSELAERLGKPQSYVSKVERGERRLDVVEFVSFVSAMNGSFEQILERVASAMRGDS